jgi:hypothetical protein
MAIALMSEKLPAFKKAWKTANDFLAYGTTDWDTGFPTIREMFLVALCKFFLFQCFAVIIVITETA